jgi:acyl carrier protein
MRQIDETGVILGATVVAYGRDQIGCYIVLRDPEIKKEMKTPPKPVIAQWTREKIQVEFLRIVHEKLGVSEEKVIPTATFVDDLGADSLDTVELVMAIEDEFNIVIEDDDAEKLRTVRDALCYLCEKML